MCKILSLTLLLKNLKTPHPDVTFRFMAIAMPIKIKTFLPKELDLACLVVFEPAFEIGDGMFEIHRGAECDTDAEVQEVVAVDAVLECFL